MSTTLTLPASDPRGARAVAIATDAGQWLKVRAADGRKAYGIRSSRNADEVYFVTRTSCTCFDAERHECKHMLAVRLHCALVAEQEARASVGPDNIVQFDQTVAAIRAAAAQAAEADRTGLNRILGGPAPWTRPQRGVIPASQIERED